MREIDVVKELLRARGAGPDGPVLPWPQWRAQMDESAAFFPLPEGWTESVETLAGLPARRLSGPEAKAGRLMLYLHGGGYAVGSSLTHRGLAAQVGQAAEAAALVLDYRLAPEHPAPAALDDAHAAFLALMQAGTDPEGIFVAGDSAGAGLAVALTQRLIAENQPRPRALFLMSPWVDMTLTGRSVAMKAGLDPMLSKGQLERFAEAYRAGRPNDDAVVSPLYASFADFPPMLIQVGTDEVLLSDAEQLQSRAAGEGADATLEVWPGMIHVFQLFYPMLTPARDALESAGKWLRRR